MWTSILLLLVTILLQLTLAKEDFQCPSRMDSDVLILGAGVSGVSAARTLHDAGVSNYIIIEGKDRIGGRIRSEKIGNITVNIGANWIAGVDSSNSSEKENPIWSWKKRCGLKATASDFDDDIYYDRNGDLIDEDFRWDDYYDAADQVLNMSLRMPTLPPGIEEYGILTVKDAFELAGWVPLTEGDAMVEYFEYDWTITAEKPVVSGLKLYKVEFNTLASEFGDEEFVVYDTRGFNYIVDCIADQFLTESDPRLILNTTVKEINWKDECVCVDIQLPNGQMDSLCGLYAITTFSAGVLYDSAFSEDPFVKFWPTLPQWKLDALQYAEMSYYFVMYAKFEYIFWDDNEYIGRAVFGPDDPQSWPIFQPLGLSNGKFSPDIPEDTPILWATVTGDEARRINNLTQQQIIDELMDVLRGMYGQDIPSPSEVVISNWLNDPYFRGVWVNYGVGADTSTIELVRAPLGGLFFSGDSTSVRYTGYVHGAYLEGELVAEHIAALLSS